VHKQVIAQMNYTAIVVGLVIGFPVNSIASLIVLIDVMSFMGVH
jgi:hypothetical protein